MVRSKSMLQNVFNRRAISSLLIGFTLCISIWQIYIELTLETINISNLLQTLQGSLTSSTAFNQLNSLSDKDYEKLMDLENFSFIKSHRACNEFSEQPIVVVLIHSAPSGFQKRQVIRETWGQIDPRSLLLFIVGTVNSTDVQEKIDEEYEVSLRKQVREGEKR